jgi:hypothetical protein
VTESEAAQAVINSPTMAGVFGIERTIAWVFRPVEGFYRGARDD